MGEPSLAREGTYVQYFVYKVPKENRVALRSLLREILQKLVEHGTIRSDCFQLHSYEAFQGFVTIARAFTVSSGEELWMELDHYADRGHRDIVMAGLAKDPGARALFGRLAPLVSKGYSIVMGEFERLAV